MQGRAKSLNLPTHITIDAGRTQIAPSEFFNQKFNLQWFFNFFPFPFGLIIFLPFVSVDSRTVMVILGKPYSSSTLKFSILLADLSLLILLFRLSRPS
jgi:hypothetical protein